MCSTSEFANRGSAHCEWVGVFWINLVLLSWGPWIFISTSQLLSCMWSGLLQGSFHDFQAVEWRCFLSWTAELIVLYGLQAAPCNCILPVFPGQFTFYLNSSFSLIGFSGEDSLQTVQMTLLSFSLPLHFNATLRHKQSHSKTFYPY